jgi:hypothetical protein
MANNYDVNYDDQRFAQVESSKNEALTELEETYGSLIGESDKYYQAQIDASKQWADTQTKLQQEQTDFNIEQINQQKEQAHKDYVKEQSGAYVDWRKQSNEYGSEAEKMASAGLAKTGYSESSQVSMYNTYQNRVATARETFSRAVLNYDNAIKDARLQNNAALAEIAYQSLQTQLELSLQGFQYKNNLILEQANKKTELDNMYYGRYMDVLNQINTENAMAEEIRQYNQNYDLQVKQYNESIRQFEIEIARLKEKDAKEYQMQIKELELKKQQMEEEKRQFEEQMKLKREQLAEEKRQFDAQNSRRSSGGTGNGNPTPTLDRDEKPGLPPQETTADKFFNELIKNGVTQKGKADYTQQNGQQNMKNQVNAEINAALKAGAITPAEAKKLRDTYAPRGLTY